MTATVRLTPREVCALLEAAMYYDAQMRPPRVSSLRSAGRKLLAAAAPR